MPCKEASWITGDKNIYLIQASNARLRVSVLADPDSWGFMPETWLLFCYEINIYVLITRREGERRDEPTIGIKHA
jgi:hypothetical protein